MTWAAPATSDDFTQLFKTLCRKAAEIDIVAGLQSGYVAYPLLTDLYMTAVGGIGDPTWGWKKLQAIAEQGVWAGGVPTSDDANPDPRNTGSWLRGPAGDVEALAVSDGLPTHSLKTIRDGLPTTIYYDGSLPTSTRDATLDGLLWCRTAYRRILTTADAYDVEGNTVADGMRAELGLTGLWHLRSAGAWVRDQKGGPPDKLSSYNDRPDWARPGYPQQGDLVCYDLATEVWTVLDRKRTWVSSVTMETNHAASGSTTMTYGTAADAFAAAVAAMASDSPGSGVAGKSSFVFGSPGSYEGFVSKAWTSDMKTPAGGLTRRVDVYYGAETAGLTFDAQGDDVLDNRYHLISAGGSGAGTSPDWLLSLSGEMMSSADPVNFAAGTFLGYGGSSRAVLHVLNFAGVGASDYFSVYE